MPPATFFTTNDQDCTVLLLDKFVSGIRGGPILAHFKKAKANEIQFIWKLKMPVGNNYLNFSQNKSVRYKVKFRPSENRGNMTVLVNAFTASSGPGEMECEKGVFNVFKDVE